MAIGRFISYLRVSTAKQGASGLGLEAQREAISRYLNGGQWTLAAEHVEVESGKNNARPALAAALKACRLTGATLVIAKLDRLSRNVAFLAALMDSGVEFVAADNPNATRFTSHILSAVAEHEAAMISARTKAALAAAKARGKVLGGHRATLRLQAGEEVRRPNTYVPDTGKAHAAIQERADGFVRQVGPIVRELREAGLSLRQIGQRLTEQGIRTARDGVWSADAVKAVLDRVVRPPS
jgi:DNA invertase Pin-like site-specific DNA recombinase